MTAHPYAVRALALSLSLTAVGAFGVPAGALGTAQGAPIRAASTSASNSASTSASNSPGNSPVGGSQLAESGVIVNLTTGTPSPPSMPGESFVIADMDTGKILAARAPHLRRLPASTLKALTALTLIPRLDATSRVVAEPADLTADGTHVGILTGTSYSVRNLFQGLMMASGNDAAYALARANGSVALTLADMNATAAGLGALDTLALDPSGLDKTGQTSSAYDLALIGRAAMKLPDFRSYVSTKSAAFPGGKNTDGKVLPGFKISSHNTLLYNYDGAIGIKNGYTIAAQQTFIGAATRGDKTYIVTQMSSPNGSWRPTAALLDWAFAQGGSIAPVGQLVDPGTVAQAGQASALSGALAPGTVPAEAAEQDRSSGVQHWVGLAALFAAVALVGLGMRRIFHRQG